MREAAPSCCRPYACCVGLCSGGAFYLQPFIVGRGWRTSTYDFDMLCCAVPPPPAAALSWLNLMSLIL